jgi:TIR domain-containing protein
MEPLKIFFSYSHKDKTLRDELGNHLATFVARGICETWYDGQIGAGDDWDEEIKTKLRTADFILLLISAAFLASKYIRSTELTVAMQRHQDKEAVVVPIMLRPCVYEGEAFSALQGLPTAMKAVVLWHNQDEAWTDVAYGLGLQFEKFRQQRRAPVPPVVDTAQVTSRTPPAKEPSPQPMESLSVAQEENRLLAETSSEGFQGLRELMAKPQIKEFVAEQYEKLLSAEDALQTLVDYKNVHDRLHDLQFKCYNYIFQEARKVEDDIDWRLLVRPKKNLERLTNDLAQAEQQPSMANESFDWLLELRAAGEALSVASKELSLPPLQEAGRLIKGILEIRPTVFDKQLCAAAKLLPLEDLRQALGAIRNKLKADPLNVDALKTDAGMRFSDGVDALPALSDNLKSLTDEHTRWQVVASTFWSIDAWIDDDLTGLRKAWPKLFERLRKICEGNPAIWALSILEAANSLDQLLAQSAPDDPKELLRWQKRIGQSYISCSTESGTRFYQVDLSLKRLCDQLGDVQAALARILQPLSYERITDPIKA